MKKIIFTLCFLLSNSILVAQADTKSYVEFSFGRSKHGTGDTPGYHYGFSYGEKISNKFYWQLGFEGSLNDTPDFLLTYEDHFGNSYDASLHTVTAGYQIAAGIKYNFFETDYHQFGISVLPIFRYQATSLSDIYETLYPPITNLPYPVRNIVRFEPGRSFAVGGSLRLQYNYLLLHNFHVGIQGAFQIDTHGDTLPHYALVFGKRF